MPFSPHKHRIGVLRGGPSLDYEASLVTGGNVIQNLAEEYEPVDILISRDGVWHQGGVAVAPPRVLHSVDAALNALHSNYGEDGTLQNLLESFGVPYSGSSVFSSRISTGKHLAKDFLKMSGIKSPYHILINKNEDEREIKSKLRNSIPYPLVIKPVSSSSSLGISVVQTLPSAIEALERAYDYDDNVLVEEFIGGVPASIGVIEGFRDQDHYLLPTLANVKEEERRSLEQDALAIYKSLGLRDYSEVDFVVHPKRGIFFLEVNTLPKLHQNSFFPESLARVGSNIKEFVSHLARRVLNRK